MINKKDFLNNLNLTQNYCETQIKKRSKNFASILRSINPIIEGEELFSFNLNKFEGFDIKDLFLTEWNIELFDKNNFLPEIFEKQLKYKLDNVNCEEIKFNGRILVSEYESTVTDGASEVESKGIIDIYDLPPIDTWFYICDDGLLYSWIPKDFENLTNNAIEVNCVDILKWMDSLEHFKNYINIFGDDTLLDKKFNNLKTERVSLTGFLKRLKIKYKQ